MKTLQEIYNTPIEDSVLEELIRSADNALYHEGSVEIHIELVESPPDRSMFAAVKSFYG